jgi:hypothetical protein
VSLVPGAQTVHARESWEDQKYPVFGPPVVQTGWDTVVIHYTAADDLIDGDPGEHAEDLPAYMRSMQRSYVLNRGYSLGYLWAVDWLGGIWQIRGWEYKSAANKDHNEHTVPILVLVDGADQATPQAAASIRLIGAEAERRARRKLGVVGHGQLSGAATACPGVGLRTQITAGVFTPEAAAPPPPPPTAATEVEMIAIDHKPDSSDWTALTFTGTHLAHVVNGHADAVMRRAGVQRQTVNDAELDGIIQSALTTTPPPPAWVNTARGALWQSRRG